ncbi:MAG: tRNA uridine-5-carboxymethylaminomethyl(34) synthesis enzyme MnmG [Planctomycetaceae bacterium]|jgi:tRNA uridine 5-carboxymethylaminomethyl modification enzyme|nr:tRNA uridine-5-carboxymethylaminomethyl(34) synthesis enzyme MnmG [Phycisphaerales bacterium]MCE2654100.1 tRNA uridine-5-carboxymethylaminomethyl(34) synthesis enzyme MnmG [Planctomycetaceae bacterium]
MEHFQVIVIGGGHAGVEAAWAAANLLGRPGSVALVTLDPAKVGVMSCNPAIGGLAKGQMVREIDALGGLMGLATDATGIQFRVLNASKGAAVHGPRAQCDKHAYARTVQAMLAARPEIRIIPGSVESLLTDRANAPSGSTAHRRITGVVITTAQGPLHLHAPAVVLTTGTFMRGLMHTGERQTPGGRFGESAAVGISAALRELGLEMGRLKTGTPPRLKRSTIRWDDLEEQLGDPQPQPFSALSGRAGASLAHAAACPALDRFPPLPQVDCRITRTTAAIHQVIRDNLHRAPMYSGQIDSVGPRYCPSLEDKVVRFAQRDSHQVYLEPESLTDDWIYCNGISTSLPEDVQRAIVAGMPGCEHAEIYRLGYAVEYDMVRPHQIRCTGECKLVDGLFLAGQINGTSGYEEAAGQGLIAGVNAALRASGQAEGWVMGREEGYLGVLMDDLVTKTPVEPYRMFTSRAEHRLLLRADNAADRLTPVADRLGLLAHTPLGRLRLQRHAQRTSHLAEVHAAIDAARLPDGTPLADALRRPEFTTAELAAIVGDRWQPGVLETAHHDRFYRAYIDKARAELRRTRELEHKTIPDWVDYSAMTSLRTEARTALVRFRPATMGQAGRLEGITPADLTLLGVLIRRAMSDRSRSINS